MLVPTLEAGDFDQCLVASTEVLGAQKADLLDSCQVVEHDHSVWCSLDTAGRNKGLFPVYCKTDNTQ